MRHLGMQVHCAGSAFELSHELSQLSKWAVRMPPFCARRDWRYDVPMLNDPAILDAKEIPICGRALRHLGVHQRKDEISLGHVSNGF
jgi:hypothetical protein